MQAVELFAVWVFASGIGSLRCGLFCRRVGFSQGQLYAVVFLVRGGFRKCKPWSFLRGGFLSAVFVPGGAVCFVVGWVFLGGSCTRLYLAGFVLLVVLCGSCVCCTGRFS